MGGCQRQILFLPNFFKVVLVLPLLVNSNENVCSEEHPEKPVLDQCGGKGIILRCNGTERTEVPHFTPRAKNSTTHVCVLDLSHNRILNVTDNAFVNVSEVKFLYLSENNISHIQANAFRGLRNLQYMNLSVNNLAWPDSFEEGVFYPLSNVTNINMKENPIKTFDGLGKAMLSMKKLEGLFINGCSNCSFGPDFANFAHLRNISLSGRKGKACEMANITNQTLHNVPHLYGLWMCHCGIRNIEPGAFESLKVLRILDIAYNEKLTFDGMHDALYGLKNHDHLSVLDITRIHEQYGRGIKLKSEHIQNLKTLKKLTQLHMDLNKIEVFDSKILHPKYQLPRSLRTLTLAGNRLTYDKYVKYLYNVTNITYLDISRQYLSYDPFRFKHYDSDETYQDSVVLTKLDSTFKKVPIPKDLKKLKWNRGSLHIEKIPDIYIVGADHLEECDLSFNQILRWNGVVVGFQNLKVLDLSDNACENVSDHFFSTMQRLEKLYISQNQLAKHSRLPEILFSNLSKLKKLDISSNYIQSLPLNIFKNLTSLQHLNLSNNLLEDIDFVLNTNSCIEILDFSFNKLKELPNELTRYLDEVAQKFCKYEVFVNMSRNPIECTCETLDFLRWMRDSSNVKVNFEKTDHCNMKGHERPILSNEAVVSRVIEKLEKECRNLTWLMVLCVMIVTCLVTVIACKFLYKYRWKLRYFYYSRNRRHMLEGFEKLFENDAFTSYASSKCGFIKNQFVPILEGEKFKLKVWTADRDSQVGASQAENIVHAINNSKKSILLVDQYFLKDHWCNYEMHMTRMESIKSKRPVIIIVFFDGMSLADLPMSIFKTFRDEKAIKFPEDGTQEQLDEFWEKLFDAIMA